MNSVKEVRIYSFTLLLLLYHLICAVFTFNLDVNNPIVYLDPQKTNDSRSNYFGYSLLLYPGNQNASPWIQIGVPRGRHVRDYSGTVYRCGFMEKCEKLSLNLDVSSGVSNYIRYSRPNGAGMGATMDINYNEGITMVCAPRWIWVWDNEDYRANGACAISYLNETYSTLNVNPLIELRNQIYSSGYSRIYNYGQGQAGFSISMNNEEIVLGAPGVFNWRGTVVSVQTESEDDSPIASRLQSRRPRQLNKKIYGDINIVDAESNQEVLSYELFGYSVISGRFYNKSKVEYAAAAPKSEVYRGKVVIFNFQSVQGKFKLAVKESKIGMDFGEYFGGSLTAGDIDNDGLDDLIVGAPFYSSNKYNEGKIYVFLGSTGKLKKPEQNAVVIGKAVGGQFGTAVQFIDDLDHDGFGEVAISAPYEEDGGVVYIYRGTKQGLDRQPGQRIVGRNISPNILGFGISFSKAVDIDNNTYLDLAIGAHKSGHAVILRGRPTVAIHHSLMLVTPRIELTAKEFQIGTCFWFELDVDFNQIQIMRTLRIDETLNRAFLPNGDYNKTILLSAGKKLCSNVTLNFELKSNTLDPITIELSTMLVSNEQRNDNSRTITGNKVEGMDHFCRQCPIFNKYKSSPTKSIQVPFTLGCGSDDICNSILDFTPNFPTLGTNNTFILGSSNVLKFETKIRNSGEKAYLTRLLVSLPDALDFTRIPSTCQLQNVSTVLCSVDNPLEENSEKTLTLDLDMSRVNSGKYGDLLYIFVKILTSSQNQNLNNKTIPLHIRRKADITITGKSEQQSYSISKSLKSKPNFTQIYQIQKFGKSPIDEIMVEIEIPHSIKTKTGNLKFLALYKPVGVLSGQPIDCKSEFEYIMDPQEEDELDDDAIDDDGDESKKITRNRRQIEEIYSELQNNQKKEKMVAAQDTGDFSQNRTFYINCSIEEVICSKVWCDAGPFISEQRIGIIDLRMEFDHFVIKDLLDKKDVVLFSTQAFVTIKKPPNFVQTGDLPDSAIITSTFVGDVIKPTIAIWIIIVAVIAGLLLLMLLILGLVKAGFFRRTTKEELEQLKHEMEEQATVEECGAEENLIFQSSENVEN